MLFRITAPLALFAVLSGCQGGSASVGSAGFSCGGDDPTALCLQSCSLGCSSTGCLRTDIAQNEILIFYFSDDLDENTVNTSTIQLRTATGGIPVGEFFVNQNRVEFVPSVLLSGTETFFGFQPGEIYTLTIPGGANQPETIRSTSGRKFFATYSCTLDVSLGIQDLNGVNPRATLVSPSVSQLESAPLNSIIILHFNEMVDVTPFLTGSPVLFSVRRTVESGGVRSCDPGSQPFPLPGTPRLDFDPSRGVSVLTFRPATDLPGNACIEISVTSAVVDLAGNSADPQAFTFLTEAVPLVEEQIVEEFDDDSQLDREVSGGTWNAGIATFAKIGGDARHGSFSTDLCTNLGLISGRQTFLLNTDLTTIPHTNTFTGSSIAVTDGRFYFSDFVLEANHRLVFTGSNPPIITVAGNIEVRGEIKLNGETLAYPANFAATAGQIGGVGGIFGGDGGNGGDRCTGLGALAAHQGKDGDAVNLLGGHGYLASRGATAGRGSLVFPLDGLNSSVYTAVASGIMWTPMAAAGGGGGANYTIGEVGRVVANNHNDPGTGVPPRLDVMGPATVATSAMQLFPFPAPSGLTRSSEHFLVGGAGGGGGASHTALGIVIMPTGPNANTWASGGGGGGGGGAIALRAGDLLRLESQADILAAGGSAGSYVSNLTTSARPCPGGGGAGGSVILQSGRQVDLAGGIDVRGGTGGYVNISTTSAYPPPQGGSVEIAGGDGGDGFVRLELPGAPTPALLPGMLPAAVADNVGTLAEEDDLVSFRSKWYSTGLLFGPQFLRYEIHATVNGSPQIFSDDPAVSTLEATVGSALRLWIQSGQVDTGTGALLESREWRTRVQSTSLQTGISSDGLNAFRFAIVLDRTVASNVTIDKFVVVYGV